MAQVEGADQTTDTEALSSRDDENQQEETKAPLAPPSTEMPPKANLLKRLLDKFGIQPPMLIVAVKGGIAPIICLAAYQSDAWAAKYSTIGYLAAIMSLISLAIQPRAKFVQSMILNLAFVCVGAAISLLQIQCTVAARKSTTPKGPSGGTHTGTSGSTEALAYNPAASTVAGIFLFMTIYGANVLKSKFPQLTVPTIMYCIFTIVASSSAPSFPNMVAGKAFASRLIQTFLTGFGIATGVSLFIVPMTSRTIASSQIGGALGLIKASLAAQSAYMSSISEKHRLTLSQPQSRDKLSGEPTPLENGLPTKKNIKKKDQLSSPLSPEAQALKQLHFQLAEIFSKINLELSFAKKEIAFGKLSPEDFSEIFILLRNIMLPIVGVTTFIDLMESLKSQKKAKRATIDSEEIRDAISRLEAEEWDEAMALSNSQAGPLQGMMLGGLTHISYVLELAPKPKAAQKDVEKSGSTPGPGDPGFAAFLEEECKKFYAYRVEVVKTWCERKDLTLPTGFWEQQDPEISLKKLPTEAIRRREDQAQLYLMLFVGYLMQSVANNILAMMRFADSKVEDGTMAKRRLIVPPARRLRKLIQSAFQHDDNDHTYDLNGNLDIYLGDALLKKKDPEHLPPATGYQRATNYFRAIPRHYSSPESSFGFRCAVATMSIGVLAYLRNTHTFFLQQRILWAMIMIAISMAPHAGSGIFGFVTRVMGTAVASAVSIIVWYMGGQKTAAILPLLYIFLCGGFLFLVKNPQLAVVAIISMVTSILIIRYELQERKIGIALTTSSGQPFYKIYLLAPYRLATVVGGLAVAFFWTYFPYPVTTHSTLRKDTGGALYLLANYYSCVHTTVDLRLHLGSKLVSTEKGSPGYRLDKARHKVFIKVVLALTKLREHSNFARFEPTFGGKFPKEKYDQLIVSMQNVFNYMNLISYSTTTFAASSDAEESGWLRDFRTFTRELNITSHDMTSTLCLVSASLTNSQPLPPYLKVPRPFDLAERLHNIDPELLSVKHVSEPCYAAFAVLEVASRLVTEEMAHIVKHVQDLVGEVDFSFHVISTADDNSSTASTLALDGDGKGKTD